MGPHLRRLAALLLVTASLLAQQPVFRLQIDEVPVYVTVTDKKGHPVRGLEREDFQIFEDGVLQQIDIFQEIEWGHGPARQPGATGSDREVNNVRPAAVGAAAPSQPVPERRYFVLRFDPLLGLPVSKGAFGVRFDKRAGPAAGSMGYGERQRQVLRAQQAARAFVEEMDPRTDYAAVSWKNALSEFTQDRKRLLELIEAMTPGKTTIRGVIAGQGLFDAVRPDSSGQAISVSASGAGNDEISSIFGAEQQQDIFFEVSRQIMVGSHLDAADLISRLKGLKGRKILLYFGEGLPVPTRDDSNMNQFDPDYNARLFNDAGFTVYAISPRGQQISGGPSFMSRPRLGGSFSGLSPRARSEAVFRTPAPSAQDNIYLKRWTETTGGMAYYGRNNLKKGMRRILERASHVYLLAYRSSRPEADNSYRKIRVKVGRKHLRVHHRGGYFATLSGRGDLLQRTLNTALINPADFHDFPVTLAGSRQQARQLRFKLLFPFHDIPLHEKQVPGPKKGETVSRYYQEIHVLVAAFTATGKLWGSFDKRFFLDLSQQQMEQMRSGNATLERLLPPVRKGSPALLKTVVVVGQNEQIAAAMQRLQGG